MGAMGENHKILASVELSTCVAPACNNVRAISVVVYPVVRTSSMIKILRPFRLDSLFGRIAKAPFNILALTLALCLPSGLVALRR